jgi:hypothetical protein
MDEIADCLDAWPPAGRSPEEGPGLLGKPIGFAVTAPEQKHQCFRRRQILHGVLWGEKVGPVRQTAVVDERVGEVRMSPGGSTIRLHQLPKPSR